ncbi:MAG: FAD-binding protein [Desulfocucumaceae bacterium]
MTVKVSSGCIGCQACIETCPYGALYIDDQGMCRVNAEKCTECGQCVEVCPVGALVLPAATTPDGGESHPPGTEVDRTGGQGEPAPGLPGQGVWVFIEQREGQIAAVSLELLGAGRQLADKLGVELACVIPGDRICHLVEKVYEYGADRAYVVEDPALQHYRTEAYTRAIVPLVRKYQPEILLIGATNTGRDLAGAVATELKTGLTADCTGLDIEPRERVLLATRPAFGGNIMATIVCKQHRPQMATVRPRVMRAARPVAGRQGVLVRPEIEIFESDMLTRVLEIVRAQGDQVNLQDAEIIVSGGRGLGDRAGFEKICFGLAEAIGAQVGASRAAVEAGWIEQRYQVGQTGIVVAPKIYFALGISGAIQHLVGIRGSDIIIAVNKDPEAPIFNECTFGIVGDAFKIVPLLIDPLRELLKKRKSIHTGGGQGGSNCA